MPNPSHPPLINILCPDGFSLFTSEGYFLSACIREGIIILLPLVMYSIIGFYRFSSVWDYPLWNKWFITDLLLNRRISLIYKLSWLLKFICIAAILVFIDFRTFFALFDSNLRGKVPGITYVVDLMKFMAWLLVLTNFLVETRRNLRTWTPTVLFYIVTLVSTLLSQVFYIQVVFSDRELDAYDLRGIFFEITFLANFVLVVLSLLSIVLPQIDRYEDRVTEARIARTPNSRVNLRVIDVFDLLFMGWYFIVPGLVFAAGQGVAVQFIADIAGKVLEVSDAYELRSICLPFLWLIPIAAVCTIFQMSLLGLGGETILMKLRNRLFASFGKQDMSFFQKTGVGYLCSRMSSDCDVIGLGLTVHLSAIVPPLVSIVTGIVLLLKNSLTLSVLLISLLILSFIVTIMRSRIITQRYAAMYSDKRAIATRKATEVIQGMEVVKTFGKETEELRAYKKLTFSQRVTGFTKEVLESCFEAVEISLNKLIIALGVYLGAVLVIQNQIERAELNSYLLVGIQTLGEFYNLIKILPELYNISAPCERVFTLMKMKPSTNMDAGSEIPDDEFKGGIEFKDVTFSYPAAENMDEPPAPVLHNISLKIEPGESIAFVGGSGSGKSTMLSLVLRFFDVQEGAILIDGRDIKTLKPRWWLEQLGIVSQKPFLFSGTIEDNIKYSCKTPQDWKDEDALDEAIETADVAPVIDSHDEGIQFHVGNLGQALSGGQQQRVSIARMARKHPRLLCADEATSALDGESEQIVMNGLRRLAKGKTTLIVAHRLHTITFCDRIVCMNKGKIVEIGSHDELMKKEDGYYRKLFEKQQSAEAKNQDAVSSPKTEADNQVMEQLSGLLDSLETYNSFNNPDITERVTELQALLKSTPVREKAQTLRQEVDLEERREQEKKLRAQRKAAAEEEKPLLRAGESLLESSDEEDGGSDV